MGIKKISKRRAILAIVAIILIAIILKATLAEEYVSTGIFLKKGKNNVELNFSSYAKNLVAYNPSIEYISYTDKFLGKNYGYVNVFGGIGRNFPINPGETYEISVKEDAELLIGG